MTTIHDIYLIDLAMIFSAPRFGPKLWGALQIHGGLFILIIIILANSGIVHKIKEVETNKYGSSYYYCPLVAIFLTIKHYC